MPDDPVSPPGDADTRPTASADEASREAEAGAATAAEAPWPRSGRRFTRSSLAANERERMLGEARDITFPVAVRGYKRDHVDRYVKEVNRVIAELEISSSPEAAVRHALDEVGEETREILQRAHLTAEEITARSRTKADERMGQAEQEASELREAGQREADESLETAASEAHQLREAATHEAEQLREAAQSDAREVRDAAAREAAELKETTSRETRHLRAVTEREADERRGSARREADEMLETAERRARELTQDAEALWRERRRLIEDITAVAGQLLAIGEAASERFRRFDDDVAPARPAGPSRPPGKELSAGQREPGPGGPEDS
jgi:DivIVA domain-containing protein